MKRLPIITIFCLAVVPLPAQILSAIMGQAAANLSAFTLIQTISGNPSNEAATCGQTTTATTCVVSGSIAAGHAALVMTSAAPNVYVTQSAYMQTSTTCGTINWVRGIDKNGITTMGNLPIQVGWIYPTTSCTNPTITYNGAHKGTAFVIEDFTVSNGGTPFLNAYGSVSNTSATSALGPALSCSGTSNAIAQMGSQFNNATAVSSPYSTNVSFYNMYQGDFGTGFSGVVNASCPTATWTIGASADFWAAAVTLGLNGTACQDYTVFDASIGSQTGTTTASSIAANVIGYLGTGNAGGGATNSVSAGLSYSSSHYYGFGSSFRTCFGGSTVSTSPSSPQTWVWATGTTPTGTANWNPPENITNVSVGQMIYFDVPNSDNSHQYSMWAITNGTDFMDPALLANGTQLSIFLECSNGTTYNGGTLGNVNPNTPYWLTGQFNAGIGASDHMSLYTSTGTLIGSASCTNGHTNASVATSIGLAGVSGAELEASGYHIWFSPMVIDTTGTTYPFLPTI